MYLFLSILLSVVLGYLLLMLGPIFGGIVAFGILTGTLFRGIYLLNDIRKRMAILPPGVKKVEEYKQVTEIISEHLKDASTYKKYVKGKS